MNQQYTAAVIGLGRIGASFPSEGVPRTHTAAYINNTKVKLIAGIDPNPEARQNFRVLWGDDIKLFASVNVMLNSGIHPDIVSICTTPEILQENIKDFRNHLPKIYFLEKPTVSTLKQSNKLLQLVGNIPAAINYHRCWDPKHQIFFENLDGKKISTVRVLYTKGLLNYASHIIALLIQHFGEVNFVTSSSEEQENTKLEDQSYKFTLHFKQGFSAIFQGFDDIDYDLLEIDAVTDAGIYSLKSGGCRQRYEKPVEDAFYPNYTSLTDCSLDVEDGQVEGLPQAVENIVSFLDKKTDNLECDLQCGLDVFKVIEQVKELYQNREFTGA
jgi:predicted dehydrogenase